MIGVVDVDFASWISGSAGCCGRESDRRGNPIRVAVDDYFIVGIRLHGEANRMMKGLRSFIGPDVRHLMVVPPVRTGRSFFRNCPQNIGHVIQCVDDFFDLGVLNR